jgi:hypothetical protein
MLLRAQALRSRIAGPDGPIAAPLAPAPASREIGSAAGEFCPARIIDRESF